MIGLEKPNEYQVTLSWPDAKGTVRISENSKVVSVLPASAKSVTLNAAGGSQVSYLMEQISRRRQNHFFNSSDSSSSQRLRL